MGKRGPPATTWTPEQDLLLQELRSDGKTWEEVCQRFHRARNVIMRRAKELGLVSGGRPPRAKPQPLPDRDSRIALPPCHPIAWAVLRHLTPSLEDSP